MRRVGKLGIVRLTGIDLADLRARCFDRDGGECQNCGKRLYINARFAGDPDAYDMAHVRNKRMYGDAMDNVRALCHRCHMLEHAGGKSIAKGQRPSLRDTHL